MGKIAPNDARNWEHSIKQLRKWLSKSDKSLKILIEQNRNLGDTLHLVPVIKHYRLKYPEALIVFLVGKPYASAHELNPDIDKIFTVSSLKPKMRIELRKKLLSWDDIKLVSPSIFPYAAVWKELTWSYPNIADQYLHNSGIKDLKPLGGRRLRVYLSPEDLQWANKFLLKSDFEKAKFICTLEYNSYSHRPVWQSRHFKAFAAEISRLGGQCISLAGPHEKPISGTIDGTGISWRKTVALMEKIDIHVGIGSGLTMLAASAENQPKICEIKVPESITMKKCGYANSLRIVNNKPIIVARHIRHKVL